MLRAGDPGCGCGLPGSLCILSLEEHTGHTLLRKNKDLSLAIHCFQHLPCSAGDLCVLMDRPVQLLVSPVACVRCRDLLLVLCVVLGLVLLPLTSAFTFEHHKSPLDLSRSLRTSTLWEEAHPQGMQRSQLTTAFCVHRSPEGSISWMKPW